MKVQVHCQKENIFTWKNIAILFLMFVLVFVIIWTMAPGKSEKEFLVITMLSVYLVCFLALGAESLCHKKLNYLVFDENIRLHTVTGESRNRTCQYSDVKAIYVDECPDEYRQRVSLLEKGFVYSTTVWTSLYGKYIIAADKHNNILFVCSYQQEIWDMLIARCKSLEFVMDEEEYNVFKAERQKLKEQIEKETLERGIEQYFRSK